MSVFEELIAAGEERTARWALASVSEPGDLQLGALVAEEGAVAVWRSLDGERSDSTWARRRQGFEGSLIVATAKRLGLRYVMPGDAEWPQRLADLGHCEPNGAAGGPPLGLWVRGPGDLTGWTQDSVSIVGSRAATSYGETVAADLAADLAGRGLTTVSGGAYGIDACAHRGAIGAHGRTVCVLACGVDQYYPRGNSSLLERIAGEHLLVSELPPGAHPTRPRFLTRNRLIAALSMGTVIVEAGARSGARNTITWASGCGRPVMAVPGSVHSTMSVTPHELIRSHEATLVTGAGDVHELLAPMGQQLLPLVRGRNRLIDRLEEDQRAVFENIPGRGSITGGEVALRSGLDMVSVVGALSEVAELGLIEQDDHGHWKLVPGAPG